MDMFTLKTPVALVIFNRPQCVSKSFEAIRSAKPRDLFIIADGPREDHPNDVRLCRECREIVEDIDWDCRIHRNYSNINLGCGKRPATGFSWLFEEVDSAIILEDDCIPSMSFFRFCQELLEKYHDDERIDSIAGCNFGLQSYNGADYYFSRAFNSWGWASWSRVWKKYDYEIKNWPEIRKTSALRDAYMIPAFVRHWESSFDKIYNKEISSAWDFQFDFLSIAHGGVHIYPQKNLISYIGFNENATHVSSVDEMSRLYKFTRKAYEMDFPLQHPLTVASDFRMDVMQMTDIHGVSPSDIRFVNHIDKEKIDKIKSYDKILIYGAGMVARDVIYLLTKNGIDCFRVAVTYPHKNNQYVMGNPVYSIDECLDYRENGVVVVSVGKKYVTEVKDILKKKGFQNTVYIMV